MPSIAPIRLAPAPDALRGLDAFRKITGTLERAADHIDAIPHAERSTALPSDDAARDAGSRAIHRRVRAAHDRLLAAAEGLVRDGVIAPRRLHGIWRVQGYRVVARSTLALIALLRAEWAAVEPTGLTLDELDRWEGLAIELARAAAAREARTRGARARRASAVRAVVA